MHEGCILRASMCVKNAKLIRVALTTDVNRNRLRKGQTTKQHLIIQLSVCLFILVVEVQ